MPFLPWFPALHGSRRAAISWAEVLARLPGKQIPSTRRGIDTPTRARAPSPGVTSGPIVGKDQENSLRHRPNEAVGIVQGQIRVQQAHRELAGPRPDLGRLPSNVACSNDMGTGYRRHCRQAGIGHQAIDAQVAICRIMPTTAARSAGSANAVPPCTRAVRPMPFPAAMPRGSRSRTTNGRKSETRKPDAIMVGNRHAGPTRGTGPVRGGGRTQVL